MIVQHSGAVPLGNTFELIFEICEDLAQAFDDFALSLPEAAPVRFQKPSDERTH